MKLIQLFSLVLLGSLSLVHAEKSTHETAKEDKKEAHVLTLTVKPREEGKAVYYDLNDKPLLNIEEVTEYIQKPKQSLNPDVIRGPILRLRFHKEINQEDAKALDPILKEVVHKGTYIHIKFFAVIPQADGSLQEVDVTPKIHIHPNIKPTITSHPTIKKGSAARIVVNVYPKDGKAVYTDEEGKEIKGVKALKEYITSSKAALLKKNKGADVTLHMRCDRRLPWKDIQVIQKAAAEAGILEFNFASYQQNPKP